MHAQTAPARTAVVTGLAKMAAMTLVTGLLMFLVAGTARWPWAWAYLALVAGELLAYSLVLRPHAGLAEERRRPPADAKAWDKPFVAFIAGIGPFALLLWCALDRRLAISPPMARAWQVVGLASIACGGAFSAWAIAHNRFFSALIRIQRDRGHIVVDTGPYAIVRHPGYTGSIFHTLGTSLALGSWWSLAVSVPVCLVIAVRTALEDRTLQQELDGYAAYARRVRYRLLAGVW